ncbi:AtpZ/AtpI family protein [Marinoscillum sp. MHG1-6]|uniref:AtpZ/AtpI family protein n=1 Tax=Marinoscillum sp. MHG1-6 TaxID=2959627 RepID=UPI0035BE3990
MEQKKKENHFSKPSPDNDQAKNYARVSGITFEILSLNLIIICGGYYLNEWLSTKFPWALLFSIFLSVAATIFYLLKKFGS